MNKKHGGALKFAIDTPAPSGTRSIRRAPAPRSVQTGVADKSMGPALRVRSPFTLLLGLFAYIDGRLTGMTVIEAKSPDVLSQSSLRQTDSNTDFECARSLPVPLKKLKCHSIDGEPEVTLPELEDKDLEELNGEALTMKSTMLKENLTSMKPNMAAGKLFISWCR
ncbi:hypothetical protein MTO96_000644 [Rhipicephalus appendiculatus]